MNNSYKRLTLEQRRQIKVLRDQGYSLRKIASIIGVSNGTVHYELNRHLPGTNAYDPDLANAQSIAMQSKGPPPLLSTNKALAQYISDMILLESRSVEDICDHIRDQHLFNETLSINTVYRAIDQNLIPNVTRESLRTNKTKMFSNGMVCIPKWAREKFGFHDGDTFSLDFHDDGTITLKKQAE